MCNAMVKPDNQATPYSGFMETSVVAGKFCFHVLKEPLFKMNQQPVLMADTLGTGKQVICADRHQALLALPREFQVAFAGYPG